MASALDVESPSRFLPPFLSRDWSGSITLIFVDYVSRYDLHIQALNSRPAKLFIGRLKRGRSVCLSVVCSTTVRQGFASSWLGYRGMTKLECSGVAQVSALWCLRLVEAGRETMRGD